MVDKSPPYLSKIDWLPSAVPGEPSPKYPKLTPSHICELETNHNFYTKTKLFFAFPMQQIKLCHRCMFEDALTPHN